MNTVYKVSKKLVNKNKKTLTVDAALIALILIRNKTILRNKRAFFVIGALSKVIQVQNHGILSLNNFLKEEGLFKAYYGDGNL